MGAENEKKQQDVLRNTAVAEKNEDGTTKQSSNTVTKNIDSLTKDAGEKKILSRVLPRVFMKHNDSNENDIATSSIQNESGKIRQREEETTTISDVVEEGQMLPILVTVAITI